MMNWALYDKFVEKADSLRSHTIQSGYKGINEMSILFHNRSYFDDFVATSKERGLWFAESQETQVNTENAAEWFTTDFQFVWPWEGADWRLEVMIVTGGEAPLHKLHTKYHGEGCIVHASYKLPDRLAYEREVLRLEQWRGREYDKEYKNGYGIFSYWDIGPLYLKPRANMRDA